MVELQYQAVNHTTFDTIKTVATMIPYHIMGLRLFSILFNNSGKNVKKQFSDFGMYTQAI